MQERVQTKKDPPHLVSRIVAKELALNFSQEGKRRLASKGIIGQTEESDIIIVANVMDETLFGSVGQLGRAWGDSLEDGFQYCK